MGTFIPHSVLGSSEDYVNTLQSTGMVRVKIRNFNPSEIFLLKFSHQSLLDGLSSLVGLIIILLLPLPLPPSPTTPCNTPYTPPSGWVNYNILPASACGSAKSGETPPHCGREELQDNHCGEHLEVFPYHSTSRGSRGCCMVQWTFHLERDSFRQ